MGNESPAQPSPDEALYALLRVNLSRNQHLKLLAPSTSEALKIIPPIPSGDTIILRDGVVDSIRDILSNLTVPPVSADGKEHQE